MALPCRCPPCAVAAPLKPPAVSTVPLQRSSSPAQLSSPAPTCECPGAPSLLLRTLGCLGESCPWSFFALSLCSGALALSEGQHSPPVSCSPLPSLVLHGPTAPPVPAIKLPRASPHPSTVLEATGCLRSPQPRVRPYWGCGCALPTPGSRWAVGSLRCLRPCRGLHRTGSPQPRALTLASATCAGQSLGSNADPAYSPEA